MHRLFAPFSRAASRSRRAPLAALLVAGLVTSCSAVSLAPAPDPFVSGAERASARVARAASLADARAGDDVERAIARGIDDTNALVVSVVRTLQAARNAAPTTRSYDADRGAVLSDAIALTRAHLDARRLDVAWTAPSQRALLDAATDTLSATSTFADHCDAGRVAQADVAYDAMFASYERFRERAAALADETAAAPLATWRGALEQRALDARTASR